MLDETNVLVKIFETIRVRFTEIKIPCIKLRLIGRWNLDTNQYDLLISNDIGWLIVRDVGEYEKGRDIIVESKSNSLQRITKLHSTYMSLQCPLLFSFGEDEYKIDLNWVANHVTEQSSREKNSNASIFLLPIIRMARSREYFI